MLQVTNIKALDGFALVSKNAFRVGRNIFWYFTTFKKIGKEVYQHLIDENLKKEI